jgi:hypothetical protein
MRCEVCDRSLTMEREHACEGCGGVFCGTCGMDHSHEGLVLLPGPKTPKWPPKPAEASVKR